MVNILANRAKMTTATTGTGTITLGSASSGYQSFAAAGVNNAEVVAYVIEDGTSWEVGTGTYTSAGTTLSRTVIESSAGGGAAINLSGSAVVYIAPGKADFTARNPVTLSVAQQYYNATGSTWTKPTGLVFVIVECQAGGGGGGGVGAANLAGAGGGGGGYSRQFVAAGSLGASVSVTVGTGGASTSGAAGGAGGNSSFSTFATASGGAAGATGSTTVGISGAIGGSGGGGGGAGSGPLVVVGGAGGYSYKTAATGAVGGAGGGSFFGPGGPGAVANINLSGGIAAVTPNAWGAGGGGSAGFSGTAGVAGAAGKGGVVIVWEFIST